MSIDVSKYNGTINNLTVKGVISGDATYNSIKIGNSAGLNSPTTSFTTLVGYQTGYSLAGNNSVAIGVNSGALNMSAGVVAIGNQAGYNTSGYRSTCIGTTAGYNYCGQNSVCIGYGAGVTNCPNGCLVFNSGGATENPTAVNTITINSSATAINGATANATYISPIRGVAASKGVNVLCYDPTTKEVYYSTN